MKRLTESRQHKKVILKYSSICDMSFVIYLNSSQHIICNLNRIS